MVRIIYQQPCEHTDDGFINYVEAAGLSTDTKPAGVATGSLYLAVDTGDVYAYDEEGEAWGQIAALGGGA